jgi:hypothetical protein
MLIQGSPISTKLPEDFGLGERFWYWRGASGRRYIHSIYAADLCPPLPGAIYVAVRREEGERRPVAVGRFSSFWDGSLAGLAGAGLAAIEADEIHVHLLARNADDAEVVLDDLQAALDSNPPESARGEGRGAWPCRPEMLQS